MKIGKEPQPTPPPSEEPTITAMSLTIPPVNSNREMDQKPIVTSDANNNGIPETDRNANQAKCHVCQECGKTFVTKASLKVKSSDCSINMY